MKRKFILTMIPGYIAAFILLIVIAVCSSRVVTVYTQNIAENNRSCIVIDAGHGGEDGGAISVTGESESNINLQIALKTNDLMHLLGLKTVMIRTDDRSVYTQGTTLSQKKVSDLKERVRVISETNNPILISIHQNYFSNEKYSGLQVFYPNTTGSKSLASELQNNAKTALNKANNRTIKKTNGVYLMDHIDCTAVLVECGFLSNYQEEALLRNNSYQKKLAGLISVTVCNYLDRICAS